jgi:hypothetical protein
VKIDTMTRKAGVTIKLKLNKNDGTDVPYYTVPVGGTIMDQTANPIKTPDATGIIVVHVPVDSLPVGILQTFRAGRPAGTGLDVANQPLPAYGPGLNFTVKGP